jgi:hypothetical protein
MNGSRSRLFRLGIAGLAAAAFAVLSMSPASAAPAGVKGGASPATTGIVCHDNHPYLNLDPYGPVAQCMQVEGSKARAGLYSPFTAAFSPYDNTLFDWIDTGCHSYPFQGTTLRGCVPLDTHAFGAVIYVTQYSGGFGRWGTYSINNGTFAASGNWFPVV